MKKIRIALATTLLLTAQVHAQDRSVFGETVEVRITNVEAIVTDKSGKPVHGLTKEDFEVYEDGVKQEITNFAEIADPTSATPGAAQTADAPAASRVDTRRRLITIFVDNDSLEHGNRSAVLPPLRDFLQNNVRGGDGVAMVAWGPSLTVGLEPTSDTAAITAAVDQVAKRNTAGSLRWREDFVREIGQLIQAYAARREAVPLQEAVMVANSYAARASLEMRRKAEALKSVIASLRGVEGRKVLVLVTQSLTENPAEEAFLYLAQQRGGISGLQQFNPHVHARSHQLKGLADDIIAAANAAGVALYPINAMGKFADMRSNDRTATNTLESGTATLHQVAEDTGGRALSGTSNYKVAFDTIANDLNVYYSLGYRAAGERQDRMKRVEVKLLKRGYVVRTRKAIVEQTASSEMSDTVAANLFQPRLPNDLQVAATVGAPTLNGENLVHPLMITIPTSTLTLVPDGADLVGKFSVFAAFARADGAVSKVGRQEQQFRFPAASLARRKQITVKLDVIAEPAAGTISLGVIDEISKATGFTLVKLQNSGSGS